MTRRSRLLVVHEQRGGLLQIGLDRLNERGRVPAVDDAVIEGGRQVHHLAHDYLAALNHRLFDDLVDADNRDFRRIYHRRRNDSAERAEARYRDGRADEFLSRRLAVARTLGEPGDFLGAFEEVERLGVTQDGNHQAGRRLRRNADMDGAMAPDDSRLVVEQRVALRIARNRPDHRANEKGQNGELAPPIGAIAVQMLAQL